MDYRGVYLSHLGDFSCPSCGFKKSSPAFHSQDWPQILIGVYNKYNTLAAGLVAQELGIKDREIFETVQGFKAAFGRAEELEIEGKKVRILLSKNPVGMNETIRAVADILQKEKSSTNSLSSGTVSSAGTSNSVISGLTTVSGSSLPLTGTRGARIANLAPIQSIAALLPSTIKLKDLMGTAAPPKHDSGAQMCLSFLLRGGCWSNCKRGTQHVSTLSTGEQQRLTQYLTQRLSAVAPSSGATIPTPP